MARFKHRPFVLLEIDREMNGFEVICLTSIEEYDLINDTVIAANWGVEGEQKYS